jgi:hypothetical protein
VNDDQEEQEQEQEPVEAEPEPVTYRRGERCPKCRYPLGSKWHKKACLTPHGRREFSQG